MLTPLETKGGQLMKTLGFAALASFAALLSGLGSDSHSEPVEKPDFSFSLAYQCDTDENSNKTAPFCLADSFDKELKVVLVSESGKCRVKTSSKFKEENPVTDFKFEATHLTDMGGCFIEEDRVVAVIGVDPSAVEVVEPKTDKSLLTKDMELKARKIASAAYRKFRVDQSAPDVAGSPPDVFSVGSAAFLLFKCTEDFFNQDGLPVLVLKDTAFLLEGTCALKSPFFFSANGKLHVSYWATVACCGCGDSHFFVYDLSGASPKLVYQNSDFSD
jgi:hypothetical protein